MAEKEAKVVKEAKLVEVPKEFVSAVELEDGSIVGTLELCVLIYNKIVKLEKHLTG